MKAASVLMNDTTLEVFRKECEEIECEAYFYDDFFLISNMKK